MYHPKKTFYLVGLFCMISHALISQHIDTIDFESPSSQIQINSSLQNSWQIGIPSKAAFDSAYAGTRAIMTDTLNPYPANDSSSFTLDFTIYGGHPTVSFYHQMQSDSGRDGGFIELSTDGGNSWLLLNDTTYRMFLNPTIYGLEVWNLYKSNDSIFKGKIGFSGSDNDWVYTQIIFPCMAIKTFWPMKLRFTFISDSVQDNLDGWMLDHFVIDNSGICAGISEFNNLPKLEAYPMPASDIIRVDINEYHVQYEASILNTAGQIVHSCQINGGTTLDLYLGDLDPGLYSVLITSNQKPVGSARILIK